MAFPAAAQLPTTVPLIRTPYSVSRPPDSASGDTPATAPIVRGTLVVVPIRDQAVTWLRVRTKVRGERAIADFFPMTGSGVRLSAGTRLRAGYSTTSVAPDTRLALRVDPWQFRGPTTLGNGFQSFAPVALAGYDQAVAEHWRLGVDVGAMRGRMVGVYPFDGSAGRASGPRIEGADSINPVADVTLVYAF